MAGARSAMTVLIVRTCASRDRYRAGSLRRRRARHRAGQGGERVAADGARPRRGADAAVRRVMQQADIAFSALDRIAVTTGPGSFTGLRVGISAARGIALAAGKPAFGLTTLSAYAAPLHRRGRPDLGRSRDRRPARARLSAGVRPGRPHAGRAAHRQRRATRCAPRATARCASSAPARACSPRPGRRDEPAPILVDDQRAPDIVWVGRLGVAIECRCGSAQAALSARA